MGRDRDRGSPVEPGEARAYGNDPDAVEVRRKGAGGYADGQVRAAGASTQTGRWSEEARVQDLARRGARQALDEKEQESGGGLYGSEIDSSHLVGAALAELVGTFILVFGGTAVAVGAILSRPTAGAAYDSLAVALAFGLALAAVVAAVGHVSGAHVNPAVTLGMAAAKKFPWAYVPVYIVAQLAGAVLGALATWLTFGGPGRSEALLASPSPAAGVGDLRAFLIEVLIGFVLVFVVMAVATDDRAPAAIAPIAVGFALAVGIFIAGPITGAAVNPARALGPMLVSGTFTSVWLYILGPSSGARWPRSSTTASWPRPKPRAKGTGGLVEATSDLALG